MIREPIPNFSLTTFDCWDDMIVFGSQNGKVYLHSISQDKYIYKAFEIAKGETMIVNCLKFIPTRGITGVDLLTSSNDCTVKVYDLQDMKPKLNFEFKEPINIAEVSPDGNLLGVYGDCLQADIMDMRS